MTGYALGNYFESNPSYDVKLSLRNKKFAYSRDNHFFFDVDAYQSGQIKKEIFKDYDYVINCIGAIKQHNFSNDQFQLLNVEFPHKLANDLCSMGVRMIHISTDCVFSGKKGNSTESDTPDPIDQYGKTKLLGEPINSSLVIRTSLIGDEHHGAVGLVSWAKSKRNHEIKGYDNHFWNGVTTKQFAKICDDIISNNLYTLGLRHVFNPTPVSKFEMLKYFNEKWNLCLSICKIENEITVDRTLNSNFTFCSELKVPSFSSMMNDLGLI